MGLTPMLEMGSLSNCDMIGVAFDGKKLARMIAVELKLRNVAAVLRQCHRHYTRGFETWAAMPPISNKNQARFADAGIGLLEVVGGDCFVALSARKQPPMDLSRWQRPTWNRRAEYVWQNGMPSNEEGLPQAGTQNRKHWLD